MPWLINTSVKCTNKRSCSPPSFSQILTLFLFMSVNFAELRPEIRGQELAAKLTVEELL